MFWFLFLEPLAISTPQRPSNENVLNEDEELENCFSDDDCCEFEFDPGIWLWMQCYQLGIFLYGQSLFQKCQTYKCCGVWKFQDLSIT